MDRWVNRALRAAMKRPRVRASVLGALRTEGTEVARPAGPKLRSQLETAQAQLETTLASALYLAGREDRAWFFTQKKSGTTYLLNVVANYCSWRGSKPQGPLDARTLNAFHSFEEQLKTPSVIRKLQIQRELVGPVLGLDALIHTHVAVPQPLFRKIVCLTRNPLDFCVSSFHFHVASRGRNLSFAEALPERIDDFCNAHLAQREVAEACPERVLWLRYEDLMAAPERAFGDVLRWLDHEPDEERLRGAIANSTKDSIRQMERRRGRPLIAGRDFTGDSFIRSGRVGEWRDVFDDALLEHAKELLGNRNVVLEEFDLGPATGP